MNHSKAALVVNTHEDISHSQVLVHAQNRENYIVVPPVNLAKLDASEFSTEIPEKGSLGRLRKQRLTEYSWIKQRFVTFRLCFEYACSNQPVTLTYCYMHPRPQRWQQQFNLLTSRKTKHENQKSPLPQIKDNHFPKPPFLGILGQFSGETPMFRPARSTRGARHVASSSFAMQRETLLRVAVKPGLVKV